MSTSNLMRSGFIISLIFLIAVGFIVAAAECDSVQPAAAAPQSTDEPIIVATEAADSDQPTNPRYIGLLNILIPLLFASMITERILEVGFFFFRKRGRDELEAKLAHTQRQLDTTTAFLTASNAISWRISRVDTNNLEDKRCEQDKCLTRYRFHTTWMALAGGGVFGAVAFICADVRVWVLFLEVANPDFEGPGILHGALDLVITTILISGGSDGIHQMITRFTSIFFNLPARR